MCFIAFLHLTDCSTPATRSIVLTVVRPSSAGKTWISTLSLTKVRRLGFLNTHLASYIFHPETQKKGMLNNKWKANPPHKWVHIIFPNVPDWLTSQNRCQWVQAIYGCKGSGSRWRLWGRCWEEARHGCRCCDCWNPQRRSVQRRGRPRLFTIIIETNVFIFWVAKSPESNGVGWPAELYPTPGQKRFTPSAVCFWPSVLLCSSGIPPRSRSNRWCVQQAPSGSWVRHQEPHRLVRVQKSKWKQRNVATV